MSDQYDEIIKDAKILKDMDIFSYYLLKSGEWELTPAQREKFIRLGGSENHSGNSWSYVCRAAYNMIMGEEPLSGLPRLG